MSEQDGNYHEYWEDIKIIAGEALDRENDGGDLYDAIRESVDGSQWVIYYWRNRKVLDHTENEPDGAEIKEYSASDADYQQMGTTAAFLAMMADVEQTAEKMRDEVELDKENA